MDLRVAKDERLDEDGSLRLDPSQIRARSERQVKLGPATWSCMTFCIGLFLLCFDICSLQAGRTVRSGHKVAGRPVAPKIQLVTSLLPSSKRPMAGHIPVGSGRRSE